MGKPYCDIPCYQALFGPEGYGRGGVEAHKAFGGFTRTHTHTHIPPFSVRSSHGYILMIITSCVVCPPSLFMTPPPACPLPSTGAHPSGNGIVSEPQSPVAKEELLSMLKSFNTFHQGTPFDMKYKEVCVCACIPAM